MTETRNSELRKLARRHYDGELDYEAYRMERTQMLDTLTRIADGDGRAGTRIQNEAQAEAAQHRGQQEHGTRIAGMRRMAWVLMAVLVALVLLILAVTAGWFAPELPLSGQKSG